ncbi:formylglycine-generating enzyme family protein, partial [Odoribacter sp. OttesenSCG-928-A06]|nr:formylglycine-generating enzyme family protein [Odoribacter sp. OttesenSCG-928-A06]
SKSNMSHTVTSYINDKKGNCIESTSSQGNKTTYKYDKHSNCIEKITEKDGVVQNKVVQNFDEKGNMIESITYNSDNEILRHRKESYDTYGNRLYYEDITVEYSEQCTYEYDEKFNWVKSIVTCTQSGEKKIFLLEREIEYYSNSFDAGEANSNPIMQGIADNMVLVQVPDGEKQTGLISNSFYINRFEVTQREWLEIMGSNPSGFRGHMDRPVEQLKLDETLEFIKKLNEATGKNYRLPTLDEWIFAAQGGAYSNKYPYPGAKKLDYVAWYSSLWRGQGNSAAQTHVVGLRVPNELGIYDMFGNVAETVQASNNTYFIIGGSWYNSENAFTYKKKASWYPGVRSDDILGFRLCHDVKM